MSACRSLDARKIRLNRRHLAIGRRIFVVHGDDMSAASERADDNVDHHNGHVIPAGARLSLVCSNKARHFDIVVIIRTSRQCADLESYKTIDHFFPRAVADGKTQKKFNE